jgi:ribulose-phosphate 3-epimerase
VHLQRVVRRIKDCGKLAGVAVNPATHPDVLEYVYEDIDLVLLMSVNPGYGGQHFIPQVLRKIEHVAGRIAGLNVKVELEVDGGINIENCGRVRSAGATVLVAGHAVLDADDPAAAIRTLKGKPD